MAQVEGTGDELHFEAEPSLLQAAPEPRQPSEWDKMNREVTMQV